MNPRRLVWWTIGIGTAVRLVIAAVTGLGVDESYAVASARQLHLSYFDHPPLSFWLVHLAAQLFHSEAHLIVRSPFILLFAATTWLMYRSTAHAFGEHEGWLAVLFLNVAPVFSLSTATWVLPDGPLMCSLAGACYCLVRVLLDPAGERRAGRWWFGAGLCAGAALLSKYQAVLFLAGIALFLIVRPAQRRWLWRAEPYAALAVALALFTPVLVWNAQHGWASFAFQLGRQSTSAPASAVQRIGAFAQTVGGQALWLLPWLWLPLIWVLVTAMARRPHEDRRYLFACVAVVPIALFTLVSLTGRPALPHWPASGYLFLFPLLGAAIVVRIRGLVERRNLAVRAVPPGIERRRAGDRRLRPLLLWSLWSIGSFAVLLVIGTSAMATGWHTRFLSPALRATDPTLEGADWRGLAHGLDSLGLLGRPTHLCRGDELGPGGESRLRTRARGACAVLERGSETVRVFARPALVHWAGRGPGGSTPRAPRSICALRRVLLVDHAGRHRNDSTRARPGFRCRCLPRARLRASVPRHGHAARGVAGDPA